MYSTIQKSKCKCAECKANPDKAKWPTLSCQGYFYDHLPAHLKAKAGTKRKVQIKNRNKRVAMAAKLHKDQKEADGHTWQLELFYTGAAVRLAIHPYCEECNAFIPKEFYRAATAHVLPKRKDYGFPSISFHPSNKLFLGAGCGCHNRYDSSWDSASKMNIWPKAVEIFRELYPYIAIDELKNIPEILLKTLVSPGTVSL